MTAQQPVPTTTHSRPALSIIIVSWNTRERLHACLASIARELRCIDHEVLVIDNASEDGSAEMVETAFPSTRLVRNPHNVGFGRASNQGMRIARGSYFLLLNSDTELHDSSVADLLRSARADPTIGVAHCRLDSPDGRRQYTAHRFPRLSLALIENLGLHRLLPKRWAGNLLLGGYWEPDAAHDVDWVTGAFMLLPRKVFDDTSGFDEHVFMYGEDLEWCYRIRDRGWRIRYYPDRSVVHFNHASSSIRWGQDDARLLLCLARQIDVFVERHGRLRGALFTALGFTGAVIRAGFYGGRSCVCRRRRAVDRTMCRQALTTLRLLARVALDHAHYQSLASRGGVR